MSKNTLTQNQYQKLLKDIKTLLESGLKKAQDLARFQSVLTYWEIGKRIEQEKLTNNANYNSLILEDLATSLNIHKDNLYRAIKLFKTYPNKPKAANLTWSHYRNLLAINNDNLRIELEKKAVNENWNVSKLTREINNSKTSSSQTKIKRPKEPNYLYKALIKNVIDGDTLLLNIDLGFQVIKEQRVRLNQINAAELKTKEGKAAFNYLRDKTAQLDYVIVQTNKIDIYGRYLADIFYPKTKPTNQTTKTEIFQNGIYLNEELLRKKLVTLI